jgi:hypothetical protein
MISVSDDGIVYAGNLSLTANGASPFKLYRWANEAATPTNVTFSITGLSAARLGDTMDLIGSDALGTTRIVAGYNMSGVTGYAIINPIGLTSSSVSVGASQGFRAGVSWVDSDTVWGITGGTITNGLSRTETNGTLTGTLNLTNAGERPMDIALINGVWLMATIEAANSTTDNNDVRIYDITDSVTSGSSSRTLLGTFNLTSSPYVANPNAAGSLTWGSVSGDQATLYAMSTNNGVQAFSVQVIPEPSAALALLGGVATLLGIRRRRI